MNLASKVVTINEPHRNMGHVNHDDLLRMLKQGGIELDPNSKPEFHEAGKAGRKPFPKRSTTNFNAYGNVVADTWGPAPVETFGRKKYYQLYEDLWSREEKVYFT